MTAPPLVPSVSLRTGQTGASTKPNEMGMRAMQERAYERRGEANEIMSALGDWQGEDPATGFHLIRRPDGRVLRTRRTSRTTPTCWLTWALRRAARATSRC